MRESHLAIGRMDGKPPEKRSRNPGRAHEPPLSLVPARLTDHVMDEFGYGDVPGLLVRNMFAAALDGRKPLSVLHGMCRQADHHLHYTVRDAATKVSQAHVLVPVDIEEMRRARCCLRHVLRWPTRISTVFSYHSTSMLTSV